MVSTDMLPGGSFVGRGKAALIGGDRVVDPAGGIIFQPDAQLPRDERGGDIGVREAGGQTRLRSWMAPWLR